VTVNSDRWLWGFLQYKGLLKNMLVVSRSVEVSRKRFVVMVAFGHASDQTNAKRSEFSSAVIVRYGFQNTLKDLMGSFFLVG
jgi:hypothetical protein